MVLLTKFGAIKCNKLPTISVINIAQIRNKNTDKYFAATTTFLLTGKLFIISSRSEEHTSELQSQ